MDALSRLKMQNMLEDELQEKFRTGRNILGGGRQYQFKPSSISSGSLPTAAESKAFNERARDRMLYGSRWNRPKQTALGMGGLEGQKLQSNERIQKARDNALIRNAEERAKTDRYIADKTFEIDSARLDKPKYEYVPVSDALGNTRVQVFENGRSVQDPNALPQLGWTQKLKEGQFSQATNIINRDLAKLPKERHDAYLDEIGRNNPDLIEYLMEQEEQKKQLKEKPSQILQNAQKRNRTLGDVLTDTSAFRRMGSTFLHDLKAPARLLDLEMPEWLR